MSDAEAESQRASACNRRCGPAADRARRRKSRMSPFCSSKYNLKTPDALHYATAVEVGATVFLTADRALAQRSEVPVQVL
jgi:predicted nucleic acid-binding protein